MIKKAGKKCFEIITKISPELAAMILFVFRTKEIPNLKNPQNFNEKMTVLKLRKYNYNPTISNLSDKYEVREYIKEKGLETLLNPIYGVYNNVEEINFEELPQNFVIKCTHGCGYNIICKDKKTLNITNAKKKLKKWMNESYGYATQELHYTKIKPKIIIEKYLCDKNDKMPIDYKIYCFNGKAYCILVCSERDEKLKLSYYDLNWKRLNYEKKRWSSKKEIDKPKELEKMIKCAEVLAQEFEFVRVDFYYDDKIIFGELTFTPACCCAPYYSEKGNKELGEKLNFPEKIEKYKSKL